MGEIDLAFGFVRERCRMFVPVQAHTVVRDHLAAGAHVLERLQPLAIVPVGVAVFLPASPGGGIVIIRAQDSLQRIGRCGKVVKVLQCQLRLDDGFVHYLHLLLAAQILPDVLVRPAYFVDVEGDLFRDFVQIRKVIRHVSAVQCGVHRAPRLTAEWAVAKLFSGAVPYISARKKEGPFDAVSRAMGARVHQMPIASYAYIDGNQSVSDTRLWCCCCCWGGELPFGM